MRVLVTGHVGFIGSHFVKYLLANTNHDVIGFNRYSDTGNSQRFNDVLCKNWFGRVRDVYGDLCNPRDVSGLCEGIDVVVNFAAKTFVDHSLKDRRPFLESNLIGAENLMDDAERYGVKRFVQVSTDEVYGQILEGAYKEDALLNPRNPYSLYKAAADLAAIQRHRTTGFPCIITRTENNFGPWQHRQKAFPTFVRAALADEDLPVYGDGMHVRCWLHVEEHCRAIWHLVECSMDRGVGVPPYLGEVFHIAGEQELTNLDLAKFILKVLGKPEGRIRFIPDHNIRPGHDRRYALDCGKLKATGFEIKQDLVAKLAETVDWYASHPEWSR